MFPKYSKKSFNNLVTGDETWVYYFEPKHKCSNRVWATKNAVHPSIAKRCNYLFQRAEPSQENSLKMFC